VANPSASSTHGSYIDAMNSGASERDVASMYMRSVGAGGSGGGGTHFHQHDYTVNTLDSADFSDYLNNRGGMDAIADAQNKRTTWYAGDGF
jgi:hypothetical protein